MGFSSWLRGGTVELAEHSSQLELIFDALVQNQTVNGTGGLGVAAIYRARQILADTLASLPLLAGSSLVPAPNADQDWEGFLAETVLSMEDSGDAYWHTTDAGLFVLPYQEMHATWSEWSGFSRRRLYEFRSQQMRDRGLTRNLKVVSMNRGANDLTGLGWLQSARIRGIIAIDEYSREFFENNAMPAGIMSVPKEPTPAEAALIKAQVAETQRQRTLMVKPVSWEFDANSFSPNDSQWTDSHLTAIGDVANLSGVPSFLLSYAPPSSTQQYENVEALLIRLWRETVHPTYATRIEDALTDVLGVQVLFDPKSLFTTNLVNRADAASKLAAAGYDLVDVADVVQLPDLSVTEVRADVPTV